MTARSPWFGSRQEAASAATEALEKNSVGAGYVYVLDCTQSRATDDFKLKAASVLNCTHDNIPSWAWAAHYNQSVYYVGSTTNFVRRFVEHCFC